ncbi:MAG TPA: hypothetical protein VHM26_11495 [Chitinophagaceae bacterium]|jgi:hypothetical protein|nr:hypothetical protein [Chitinophagaceae bacterium]
MRTAALCFLFVAGGLAANAQRFSILPQVGFENSKTNINYNDLSSFAPEGVKFSPQASLRLNYSSKQGHGFFVGVASSRTTVLFSFADPETGMNQFASAAGNMQLRFEGGYQFNSKPIGLHKSSKTNSSTIATRPEVRKSNKCNKGNDGWAGCGANRSSKKTKSNSWMRIQPSIGMGYNPFTATDVVSTTKNGQTVTEYRAGNWNTALVVGTGVEFGRGKDRLFTVSINYFKGLGNLDQQDMILTSGTKTVHTTLDSKVSGWNMRVGIPFTLAKNNTLKHKNKPAQRSCGQSRIIYRCGNR